MREQVVGDSFQNAWNRRAQKTDSVDDADVNSRGDNQEGVDIVGQAPLVGLEVGSSGKEEGNLDWAIPMGSCHKDKGGLSESSALDRGSFWQVGEWSRVKAGSTKSLRSRTGITLNCQPQNCQLVANPKVVLSSSQLSL